MSVPLRPGARRRYAGLALALLSAVSFGGAGPAAKPLIAAGLEPLQVTWLRVTGAALLMLPLAWRHRDLVRARPGLLAGFGLLAVAGVQACYFAALARISVGVALLVQCLSPVLVLVWVRLVRRGPVARSAVAGAVLAVGGLACVVQVWQGLRLDVLGLLLALGAAACHVGYFLLSDHGSDGSRETVPDPLGVVAHGLIAGALVLTVVARPWTGDWSVLAAAVPTAAGTLPALGLTVWMVLVATVAGYWTGLVAVRMLSPQVAGVVSCVEAVVATLLAWVLLGEYLTAVQLAGGAVILLGTAVAQRSAPDHPARAPDRDPQRAADNTPG